MKTTLVILAAGIGSRYGAGLKQLAKMGPNGEIIMDYSIYDAKEAGFDKVVFIIRKDIEEEFKAVIGDRIAKEMELAMEFRRFPMFHVSIRCLQNRGRSRGEPVRRYCAVKMW